MSIEIDRVAASHGPVATAAVPDWVKDAVFYQVFPERFANGDPSIDPEGVVPWDSLPTRGNFFGGDLAGITAHLDHIESLGANAIYLTPIFEADTNHRYDTADYFRVDHRLGDMASFRAFIEAAHSRGMRVVLDAVFNHCGEGHWAFRHLYANGTDSPYAEWFTFDSLPLVREPIANYATCEGCKYLPKLNHASREVRDHLLAVSRHWIDEGIDGWRLDMPFLMPQDFWREFRQEVKEADENSYIVAEVWEEATEWLQGDLSDGAMNYPLRSIIIAAATGADSAAQTAARLEALYAVTPDRSRLAMLNLLGSHDTARIRTLLRDDAHALRVATALLLTSPGAPMIYYGDEVGLEGDSDPLCRGAMPWDEKEWDSGLLEWHRALIALRRARAALRGFDDAVVSGPQGLLLRRRSDGDDTVWVVVNNSPSEVRLERSHVDGFVDDLLAGAPLEATDTHAVVPGKSIVVLGQVITAHD